MERIPEKKVDHAQSNNEQLGFHSYFDAINKILQFFRVSPSCCDDNSVLLTSLLSGSLKVN